MGIKQELLTEMQRPCFEVQTSSEPRTAVLHEDAQPDVLSAVSTEKACRLTLKQTEDGSEMQEHSTAAAA